MAKRNRVGETTIANNGMKMTIIAYRKCHDIDVRFEDNTIVCNKTYSCFKRGQINNPNYTLIGKTNTAKNGMSMTIVGHRKKNDIDIQFEDGTIVYHKTYYDFKLGQIRNPNFFKNNTIGKTNIAKNGMKMTIIGYKGMRDIDIQFEDGTIVRHKTYRSFSIGEIKNPNAKAPTFASRFGESRIAANGMRMTIVAYRKATDIDIQFEDGTITQHKSYIAFCRGHVQNPTITANKHIGETNVANNGMQMSIITYRTSYDVDIQFEDGVIIQHKKYTSFQKGQIGHPYPHKLNNMAIIKPAYIHKNVGNFYCHCTECGLKDILTVSEIKNHKCNTQKH